MMCYRLKRAAKNIIFPACRMILSVFLLTSNVASVANTLEKDGYLPTDSKHASWVFSGVVTNESGDKYGYFFQMTRQGSEFHVVSALFDGQTKTVILQEESSASIAEPNAYNWHVGRAFLRFNPINDSWIFGLKAADKKGFNFKVDMLRTPENGPVSQKLRPGVDYLISQTGQLNGHVHIGDAQEQFVTAKNAWFRQVWLTQSESAQHTFSGVLCCLNDGSGFYSMNTVDSDAIRGAEAGWFDAQGVPSAISQFINVSQSPNEGPWHIRIGSPQMHFVLSDYIKQYSTVAGFVAEADTPGFCLLSMNEIGEKTA